MNVFDFGDMETVVEGFKIGLITRATGGSYDNIKYKAIREHLMALPEILSLIPKFLKICHTTDEFWQHIKEKYNNYADRRTYLANELNPVIDYFAENRRAKETIKANSDSYEIGEVIGTGGYGTVYKYWHKQLETDFAIKLLEPSFIPKEEWLQYHQRFFREAKILFALNHDNIVRFYDTGIIGQTPFIKMELIAGYNINDFLKKYGVLKFNKSLVPIRHLLEGLVHAHSMGVIHRDLKPSNIIFDKENKKFKIIDFGISAYVEHELHTKLTRTGENIVGDAYTAPELLADPTIKDERSDIYSVGAIWYYLVIGFPPKGSNLQQMLNNAGLLAQQSEIILRCLKTNVSERFQSCKELLGLLFPSVTEISKTVTGHYSSNRLTDVTRASIRKFLKTYIYKTTDAYGYLETHSFSYHGDLTFYIFLKRLYPIDSIQSNLPNCGTLDDEIQYLIETNIQIEHLNEGESPGFQNWDNYFHFDWNWLFSDERFKLTGYEDVDLLRFLSEMFHPEVRDWLDERTKVMALEVIEGLNNLLREDGYELYEESNISGRPLFSYRYCL